MMIYLSGPVTKIKAQEFDWVSLKVSTTYRTMLAKQDFHFSAIYVKTQLSRNVIDMLFIFSKQEIVKAPSRSLEMDAEVIWSDIYQPPDKDFPHNGIGILFKRIPSESRDFLALSVYDSLKSAKK